MKRYDQFYIDGKWVAPLSSRTRDLVDPATERAFATVSLGSDADVDRAVGAARRAFATYSETTQAHRLALLDRVIDVFIARESDLAAAITQEMGSPRSLKGQTAAALEGFRATAAVLKDYAFEQRLPHGIVRHEPIGVCGLISPWNWPAQTVVTKLAPALAAGCTIVLKPSEFTPTSALVLAGILDEAGVPAGVFNLVNGDGPTVGNALCRHPSVDFVSFTGSTRAGVLVAEAAAPTVKRVCQELGGKSANIVLPDADLRAAARWNVARGFSNSGQSCHSPSRILVHVDHEQALLALLAEETAGMRVGDPNDPGTIMGPLVNAAQFERVQRYIQRGIEEGARMICGGIGRPSGLERGYYAKPTIFAATPAMAIAQEEIFGPVLVVLTYRTVDEAIHIANDTPYGLGGYIFGADANAAYAVGTRMRAGRIFYNGAPANSTAPMGGYKQSGNGREMGVYGLEEYLEVKAMFGFEALAS